jgi:hypothetical protein
MQHLARVAHTVFFPALIRGRSGQNAQPGLRGPGRAVPGPRGSGGSCSSKQTRSTALSERLLPALTTAGSSESVSRKSASEEVGDTVLVAGTGLGFELVDESAFLARSLRCSAGGMVRKGSRLCENSEGVRRAPKFRGLSPRRARKIANILVPRGYRESLAVFSHSLGRFEPFAVPWGNGRYLRGSAAHPLGAPES